MTKREEFGKLINDFANAHYECGNSKELNKEQYLEIWKHAIVCEAKLMNFLEPYLPKE